MTADIEIICPKCGSKAAYYASKSGSYRIVPDSQGKVICSNCGLNKSHRLQSKDYYYAIPVKGRILYARTLEKMKVLKDYFEEDKRLQGDPELDFPKVFYENRLLIVKLIEERIEKEQVNRQNSQY